MKDKNGKDIKKGDKVTSDDIEGIWVVENIEGILVGIDKKGNGLELISNKITKYE